MRDKTEVLFDPGLQVENERVLLRVVTNQDLHQLRDIAFNPDIWTYFTSAIHTDQDLERYVSDMLDEYSKRLKVPFVTIDKKKHSIVGMTALANISLRDARIENGWSWLSPLAQGTGINHQCKQVLSAFVFEQLQMERLEFKTDVLNIKARKALLKFGAVEEGVLRSHTLMPNNRRRDTIYFSILRHEWQARSA
ncbi:MAG: GNAT family N-acetyltransferase [Ginsengibacter sp.]